MITPKATLEALPTIAPLMVDVTGARIDINSGRTMTLDTAIARLNEFGSLLRTDMIIGSLERSPADMLRESMQFGAGTLSGLAEADLGPLSKELQTQIGRTSLAFVRNAIHHSAQIGHQSSKRHIQGHAESYRGLLPFANMRTRRHIRRLLRASEY